MKNNEFCKEIDKELQKMFEELKMVYKHLDKLSYDIREIFKTKKVDYQNAKAIEGLKSYTQRIEMAKDKYDKLFKAIEVLFKLRTGIQYDCIIVTSVISYCKGKKNYIEYSTPDNDFKKYYI